MKHIAPLRSVVLCLLLCVSVPSPGVTGEGIPPAENHQGVFAETDSCCREHDQCNRTIPARHSLFGVFNNYSFTMSHCDCDNKFHSCLLKVNESVSRLVGRTYFNLLKTQCFDLHQLQCTERDRFGMCKDGNMSLYAVVHPPKLYDSPNATEVSVNATEMPGTSNSSEPLPVVMLS